jgi:hypothetical protein
MKLADLKDKEVIRRSWNSEGFRSDCMISRKNGNVISAKEVITYCKDNSKSIGTYCARIVDIDKANYVVALEEGEVYPLYMSSGCIAKVESLFKCMGFKRVYAYWKPKNYEAFKKSWTKKILYYS